MMDGQVRAIRAALDDERHEAVAILAYSAKYASALYGPFREAVDVEIEGGGDRRAYQQDPGNVREALEEIRADVAEGADMVMVKPALAYLDVHRGGPARGRPAPRRRTTCPVSTRCSRRPPSGAGSTVRAVAMEHLTAIKRAGADLILTYLAREAAEAWLTGDRTSRCSSEPSGSSPAG